jgi:hypothetical protein
MPAAEPMHKIHPSDSCGVWGVEDKDGGEEEEEVNIGEMIKAYATNMMWWRVPLTCHTFGRYYIRHMMSHCVTYFHLA